MYPRTRLRTIPFVCGPEIQRNIVIVDAFNGIYSIGNKPVYLFEEVSLVVDHSNRIAVCDDCHAGLQ